MRSKRGLSSNLVELPPSKRTKIKKEMSLEENINKNIIPLMEEYIKSDNSVTYTLEVSDDTYIEIQINNDGDNLAYIRFSLNEANICEIKMIESSTPNNVGTFLLIMVMKLCVLLKIKQMRLTNDTDDPVRASKGIYKLFEPFYFSNDDENENENEINEDDIINEIEYIFNNYNSFDEEYKEFYVGQKYNLLSKLIKSNKYSDFNDISDEEINDLLLDRKLKITEGEMVYNINRNSNREINSYFTAILNKIKNNYSDNQIWKRDSMSGGRKCYQSRKRYKHKKYKTRKIKNK